MSKEKLPTHFQTSALVWDNRWHNSEIAIPFKIPEHIEENWLFYPERKAKLLVNEIKKHINEKAYLFGGGGNEAHMVKILDAYITKYDKYKGSATVSAKIQALDDSFRKKGTVWEPTIASWNLAVIKKEYL